MKRESKYKTNHTLRKKFVQSEHFTFCGDIEILGKAVPHLPTKSIPLVPDCNHRPAYESRWGTANDKTWKKGQCSGKRTWVTKQKRYLNKVERKERKQDID